MTYPYGSDVFSTWDFVDIWTADPLYMNNGYPFLQWQGYLTVLNPPRNLAATPYNLYVELNWEPPIEQGLDILGYNVYRDSLMLNEIVIIDSTYFDENVDYDVSYEYYITALYEAGESDPSNTVGVTCSIPTPPVVDFSTDLTDGIEPLTIQFADETLPGDGDIVSWEWDFGDEEISQEQNPQHIYHSAGIYTVTLTVTDEYDFTYSEVKENFITVLAGETLIELLTDDYLNFGTVFVADQSGFQTVGIRNIGNTTLLIESIHFVDEPLNFGFISPESRTLTLEPDEVLNIEVNFTPQTIGTLTDTLFIVNNSINEPSLTIELSGIGEYVPPMPPENITITIIDYDAHINWDPVTTNIYGQPLEPDFYFVFYNGSENVNGDYYYHGYTYDTHYVHELVAMAAEHMFYYVIAVKLYEPPAYRRDSITNILQDRLKRGMSTEEVTKLLRELTGIR